MGPWLIAGDFNLIYKEEDKSNGNLDRAMIGRFRRWLNDMALQPWSSWIEHFALLIGKSYSLTTCCKAPLRKTPTTAL
jgi:hypothetical protein